MSGQTGKRVQFQIKKGKYVWKARPSAHGSHSTSPSVTNSNLMSSRGKNSANQKSHAVSVIPTDQSESLSQITFQNQAIRFNKTIRDPKHQPPECLGEKHQRPGNCIEGKVRTPLLAIEPTQPSAETSGHYDGIVDPEYWEMMKEIGLQ